MRLPAKELTGIVRSRGSNPLPPAKDTCTAILKLYVNTYTARLQAGFCEIIFSEVIKKKICILFIWRGTLVGRRRGLENRRAARLCEFESHPRRS